MGQAILTGLLETATIKAEQVYCSVSSEGMAHAQNILNIF
jgi:pyrroline-5-carboxylate reductase